MSNYCNRLSDCYIDARAVLAIVECSAPLPDLNVSEENNNVCGGRYAISSFLITNQKIIRRSLGTLVGPLRGPGPTFFINYYLKQVRSYVVAPVGLSSDK